MGKGIFPPGTSEIFISRGEGHVTHQSVQKALWYDASSNSRVMNNIYGVSLMAQWIVVEVELTRIASEVGFNS
jgi:hypothetical protein